MKKTDNQNIPSIIHDWYIANARDLPWRNSSDPYAIWVSEMMLQQTRVESVCSIISRDLISDFCENK